MTASTTSACHTGCQFGPIRGHNIFLYWNPVQKNVMTPKQPWGVRTRLENVSRQQVTFRQSRSSPTTPPQHHAFPLEKRPGSTSTYTRPTLPALPDATAFPQA